MSLKKTRSDPVCWHHFPPFHFISFLKMSFYICWQHFHFIFKMKLFLLFTATIHSIFTIHPFLLFIHFSLFSPFLLFIYFFKIPLYFLLFSPTFHYSLYFYYSSTFSKLLSTFYYSPPFITISPFLLSKRHFKMTFSKYLSPNVILKMSFSKCWA